MQLEGSCHCGAVHFSLNSPAPLPYMHCYCSICRKTAGGGGYAINLGGDAATLSVRGEEHITVYRAKLTPDGERSPAQRHFCAKCGSALWVSDPRWPKLVHPFASAIDTTLPVAPGREHIMIAAKPDWVRLPWGPEERHYPEYPKESLAEWHSQRGWGEL